MDHIRRFVVLLPPGISVNYLLPAIEYEQQVRISYKYGGNQVLVERCELVESKTQVVVTDEVYDDKATADISEEEITKALIPFAAVDVQLSCDAGISR